MAYLSMSAPQSRLDAFLESERLARLDDYLDEVEDGLAEPVDEDPCLFEED